MESLQEWAYQSGLMGVHGLWFADKSLARWYARGLCKSLHMALDDLEHVMRIVDGRECYGINYDQGGGASIPSVIIRMPDSGERFKGHRIETWAFNV